MEGFSLENIRTKNSNLSEIKEQPSLKNKCNKWGTLVQEESIHHVRYTIQECLGRYKNVCNSKDKLSYGDDSSRHNNNDLDDQDVQNDKVNNADSAADHNASYSLDRDNRSNNDGQESN